MCYLRNGEQMIMFSASHVEIVPNSWIMQILEHQIQDCGSERSKGQACCNVHGVQLADSRPGHNNQQCNHYTATCGKITGGKRSPAVTQLLRESTAHENTSFYHNIALHTAISCLNANNCIISDKSNVTGKTCNDTMRSKLKSRILNRLATVFYENVNANHSKK